MSTPLKCPQCAASEANLLQDNIYQCKFCGSIFEYGDVKPDFENTAKMEKPLTHEDTDTKRSPEVIKKIARLMVLGTLVTFVGIGISFYAIVRNNKSPISITNTTTTSKNLYSNSNESNSSFTVVNTDNGPQVWTVSRKNSEGLKEVSYFLNKVDIKENKISTSVPIGKTITWQESLTDAYRMNSLKQMGKICWLIYGEKLIGYDVNTGAEIMNNAVLSRQFEQLRKGIAEVDDIYDMDGFKLTTKDGYVFYYAAITNKLFTQKEYEDKSSIETDFIDKTEYSFSDGERQQLYKINRKAGKVFDTKIASFTLSSIIKDNSNWYKKSYKINAVDEFTPNEIYFKAAVLYYDDKKIVLIYQKELGDNSPIILKCLDIDKNEIWLKTGEETTLFKPFLKSTNSESFINNNQLTIIQPYQIAVCLNIENGEVNWSFKPY